MPSVKRVFWISIVSAIVLTLAIYLIPTSIDDFYANPALNDTGGSYYYWRFLPEHKDIVARITAWSFFALHFVTVAYFIVKLRHNPKEKGTEYSKYNIYLLLVNLFYIVLHFVHTTIWYDALAADTPVWSSQGSVIVMLILILILENNRRGLFFGKKMPFPKESVRFVTKHHGMYITLATIFTFWFHPMEFTWSHTIGFLYMYLLFIQSSLTRTKIHNNLYWKFTLEILVLVHGTVVAFTTQNAPWAMFLFGFAAIFFITQIYGLGLKKWVIHASQAVFVLIALVTYSGLIGDRTFVDINEIFRIPVIDYVLIFVFVYAIYLPYVIKNKWMTPAQTKS
mgnify:CR=1 FL=1